jgi:UV DNA damage endonuclease
VVHIGGIYGNREAAPTRLVRSIECHSQVAQRRLALQNDDGCLGVKDVLWLHERIGARVVFDAHHHLCYNQEYGPHGGGASLPVDLAGL